MEDIKQRRRLSVQVFVLNSLVPSTISIGSKRFYFFDGSESEKLSYNPACNCRGISK